MRRILGAVVVFVCRSRYCRLAEARHGRARRASEVPNKNEENQAWLLKRK